MRLYRLRSSGSAVLAATFLLYGFLFTSIMVVEIPPYQNPDETNHFSRAEQISRFNLLPERLPTGAGGALVDVGIVQTAGPFLTVATRMDLKMTRSMYDATTSVTWGRALTPFAYPNTVIYPPFLYLPSVVGIWIGKMTGSTVVRTLYLSRLVDGLCATLVAALAIAMAEGAASWLFAVLTLPMSLALFGAVSQDGMMIAGTALAASIIAAGRAGETPVSTVRFAVLCLVMTAICMARPPYLPLAVLMLAVRWRGLGARIAALAITVAATLSWALIALHIAGVDVTGQGSDIDPGRQLAAMAGHPYRLLVVLARTLPTYWRDYQEQIVGRLGNLDVPLPPSVRWVAWPTLCLAATYTLSQALRCRSISAGIAATTLACILASLLLVFVAEYLTYTPVGFPTIVGVQGRYLIELLVFGTVILYSPARNPGYLGRACNLAVILPTAIYMSESVRACVLRFYF